MNLRVGYLGKPRCPYRHCLRLGLTYRQVFVLSRGVSSALPPRSQQSIDIARDLPFDRTGGSSALAALGQVLQTNFLVQEASVYRYCYFIDLVANIMEIASIPTKAEKRAKAAIWVRCIDQARRARSDVVARLPLPCPFNPDSDSGRLHQAGKR